MPPDLEIQGLIDLISNTTEAFTTALFLAPGPQGPLSLHAWQSLSRNINDAVRIHPGEGLVGWVHREGKAINAAQFERDTRQLLFYQVDESIKSFLAVPLADVNGVLAIDSKQRYVFTEKSQKILVQFGQALVTMLRRHRASARLNGLDLAAQFQRKLDPILTQRLGVEGTLGRCLSVIEEFSGADAAVLTAVFPIEPDRYRIMGHDLPLDPGFSREGLPLSAGLAGWVMQKRQALRLDRGRADGRKSYIFVPEEPLRDYAGFAGFPLVWGDRLRGGLFLFSRPVFDPDPDRVTALETAADRLAAALEIEFVYERVAEVSRLDPQVGLPHRTYFTKRLARLIKMASVRDGGMTLLLLHLANLDQTAEDIGQEAALEALRAGARMVLEECGPDTEVGHLGYGLLAVGLPGRDEARVRDIVAAVTSALADRPLEEGEGRLKIDIRTATVFHPQDAPSAEALIHAGLARLNAPAAMPEEPTDDPR